MSLITWNPSDKHLNVSLSNNNLTMFANSGYSAVRATRGVKSGKWYWENRVDAFSNTGGHGCVYIIAGIVTKSVDMSISIFDAVPLNDYRNILYYSSNRTTAPSNGEIIRPTRYIYGDYIRSVGDVLGIALDLDNKKVQFFRNGVAMPVIDIAGMTDEVFPVVGVGSSMESLTVTTNFGKTEFQYPTPNGFLPYDNTSVKYLIKSSNKIQTLLENNWVDTLVSQPLSKMDFETHGIDDLSAIPPYKMEELEKPYSILIWTDNTDATTATLNYNYDQYEPKWLEIETDLFKPIDILNKAESFEVLTWTDESSSIELQASGSLQTIDSGKLFSFELNDFNTIANIEIT